MGFSLEFDAKHNVLRVTLEGIATDSTFPEAYAAVSGFMATHPPCNGIVDITAVTKLDVSSEALRQLAAKPSAFPSGHLSVFVAPKDFAYGMARMFQMLGERTRPNLRVVRTLDEAYRLLGMETPEFGPLS
jgi:hypothetical protein